MAYLHDVKITESLMVHGIKTANDGKVYIDQNNFYIRKYDHGNNEFYADTDNNAANNFMTIKLPLNSNNDPLRLRIKNSDGTYGGFASNTVIANILKEMRTNKYPMTIALFQDICDYMNINGRLPSVAD